MHLSGFKQRRISTRPSYMYVHVPLSHVHGISLSVCMWLNIAHKLYIQNTLYMQRAPAWLKNGISMIIGFRMQSLVTLSPTRHLCHQHSTFMETRIDKWNMEEFVFKGINPHHNKLELQWVNRPPVPCMSKAQVELLFILVNSESDSWVPMT